MDFVGICGFIAKEMTVAVRIIKHRPYLLL
jgi:hypothetical protein